MVQAQAEEDQIDACLKMAAEVHPFFIFFLIFSNKKRNICRFGLIWTVDLDCLTYIFVDLDCLTMLNLY